MHWRRLIAVFGALALAACADPAGPRIPEPEEEEEEDPSPGATSTAMQLDGSFAGLIAFMEPPSDDKV